MSYNIDFLAQALIELGESAEWYDEQKTGLGEQFVKEVMGKVQLIATNPGLYPKFKNGNQRAVLNTFPFIVVFFVISNQNVISILSIFHTSRNPKQKFNKK